MIYCASFLDVIIFLLKPFFRKKTYSPFSMFRSSCGDQLSQLGEQLDQLGEQLGQLQRKQEQEQLTQLQRKQQEQEQLTQLQRKQEEQQAGLKEQVIKLQPGRVGTLGCLYYSSP